jgi:hypothetical protein
MKLSALFRKAAAIVHPESRLQVNRMSSLSPAEIEQLAAAWFERELERSRGKMGDAEFAKHREWIADYLREEIRERLIARGWVRRGR